MNDVISLLSNDKEIIIVYSQEVSQRKTMLVTEKVNKLYWIKKVFCYSIKKEDNTDEQLWSLTLVFQCDDAAWSLIHDVSMSEEYAEWNYLAVLRPKVVLPVYISLSSVLS